MFKSLGGIKIKIELIELNKEIKEFCDELDAIDARDKQIENIITHLCGKTIAWIKEVRSLGNQCAYTDRIIEEIITTAKALDVVYNQEM